MDYVRWRHFVWFTTNEEGNKCEDSIDVVAYYNTNKKNPNEPDIKIYESNENGIGAELVTLWDKLSKKETKYLSGKTNENEQVVAYYGNEFEEKRPFIRVYTK